jgi:CheY-like chemotaxis protein
VVLDLGLPRVDGLTVLRHWRGAGNMVPVLVLTARVLHAHGHLAVALAIGCMIAGLVMVRGALRPIDGIRDRLSGVQKGIASQLHGAYPAEVQPLVDDLNALLAHSQRVVTR